MDKFSLLEAVIKRIDKKAQDFKYAAGMNGQYHDGGCSVLMDQIKWFRAGVTWYMHDTFPKEWEKYKVEVERSLDPEYEKYLELKKKFDK